MFPVVMLTVALVCGTPFRACRKHHPAVPDRVSAVHLAEVHEQARAEQ